MTMEVKIHISYLSSVIVHSFFEKYSVSLTKAAAHQFGKTS